jgi:hypothetical protein
MGGDPVLNPNGGFAMNDQPMFVWNVHPEYAAAVRWAKSAEPSAYSFDDPLGRPGIWIPLDVLLTLKRLAAKV